MQQRQLPRFLAFAQELAPPGLKVRWGIPSTPARPRKLTPCSCPLTPAPARALYAGSGHEWKLYNPPLYIILYNII